MASQEQHGFADPHMLEKIDKLFACGAGELVDLPQIVVVGDQSSGKSSVLEGLIKKPLPRDSGLCTRFATQIVFRRAAEDRILVSIIPDRDASPLHSSRVKAWGRAVSSLDSDTFRSIMKEVKSLVKLADADDLGLRKPTFSSDVLRLEISGPSQEHLSVIDVPGIFKSTTEGVTTKADIQLVRTMVKGYMDNPRSVMLAVVPANVDVATQEILELAAEADEHGDRTLGVLTKPDLVDKGAEHGVLNLLEGRTRVMKLGWHIIRNPGQKELQDKALKRGDLEATFLRTSAPWNTIDKEKVGVDALRLRLKEVLSSLTYQVKIEIKGRLDACQERLQGLGPERNGPAEQMAYLTRVATHFQRLVSLALNAMYGADGVFDEVPELRIAPAIMTRMKTFSDEMGKYGQLYAFMSSGDGDKISRPVFGVSGLQSGPKPAEERLETRKEDDLEELVDIVQAQGTIPYPQPEGIKDWLRTVFQSHKGFELGTFNASILATCAKKQSWKWEHISMGFVSDIIVMVHRFVDSALTAVCDNRDVCNALMTQLSDDLIKRYQKAIANTKFLLEVESSDMPMTLNHYFIDNLQKCREERATAQLKESAFYPGGPLNHVKVVKLDQVLQGTRSMSNEDHIVQDIHDILQSYYKVSRKTFVDSVCKQATVHCLLSCEESPLALFSPVFVSQLSSSALEEIAGEAPSVKRARVQLSKEKVSLVAAMKILARA
ncbi:hypothetical protein LTR53_000876 [Teratosphaeriaceae sp. CCFEE 6253]|nr:hypothetical protein LTR53_000876 [Teratosphaeriaceae sp. CCFEE 6253]